MTRFADGSNRTSFAKAGEIAAGEVPSRSVFTFWGMGMNSFSSTPTQTGIDYAWPESIRPFEPLRRETTYFPGLHSVIGGHSSEESKKAKICSDKRLAIRSSKRARSTTLSLPN